MTQELHGVISLGGTVIGGSLNQRGLKGETGDKGDKGDAATIAVGTTTTGAAGTNASVTNSGDEHDAVFDFTIPKGDKGETGDVNTYIAEYGTASYADIGDAITEGKYVIAVKDDNYYPLIMFSNSSYVFSYIHENICHEVVCDSYSTWTARTHTSVRDVKQNGASVTTSGVALVTTPQPTTTTPNMDGTAAVGSETTWAKGDHVHPSDTTKVDKEVGKGLSANDFTDSLKTKLEGVESGAEVNVQSDWNQSTNTADDYIKNKPDLSVYAHKEMIKNTLPTGTASGAIASFPDGSDLFDYLSCIVNIDPVQAGSGTPSPDNVRPITGFTGCEVDVSGVNVWDEVWEVGSIDANGANETANDRIRSKNYIAVVPNTTYYIKAPYGVWFWGYDANKTFVQRVPSSNSINNTTFTVPNGIKYLRFVVRSNYGSTYNNDISINYPSTDTTYHAHAPNSAVYPVSWQTEAGTVYGGTLDVVSGELGATMPSNASIDLGSLNWYYEATVPRFYSYSVQNVVKKPPKNSVKANALCDRYQTVPLDGDESLYSGIDQSVAISTGGVISVRDENYTSASDFKTAVTGSQLVYELATPTTYQLDPVQVACLLGQNNVWADCGDIEEVKYKADVQKWVEKKLGE